MRLTEKIDGGYMLKIPKDTELSDLEIKFAAYDKLGVYEDLEKHCIAENQCGIRELLLKWKEFFDDIAALYDYRKAEEQGLLKMLPCCVGDTIFLVQCGKVYERKVSGFSVTSNNRLVVHVPDSEMDNATFPVEQVGKTIFLSRESALAEKGGVE